MRLILLCRHYPPAVTGGSRRPFHLAHGLSRAGVEVTVVAPDADPDLPSIAVPHAHRDPAPDTGTRPGLVDQVRNTARNWAYWPDPDIRWSMRLVEAVKANYAGRPDWILSTSPPESIHLAGRALKAHFRSRWCADFRDHWFERAFRLNRRNPVRRSLERAFARRWLSGLDALTGVNARIVDEIAALAPALEASNQLILPHFSIPMPKPTPLEGQGLHLVHTGSFSLSDPDCSIHPLLSAVETATRERDDLVLHLFGRLSASERQAIEHSPARQAIRVHGTVPHEQVLAYQRAAAALVVVAAETALVPPGKLSEYFSARRPIIAIGRREWTQPAGLGTGDIASAAKAMRQADALPVPEMQDLMDVDAAIEQLLKLLGRIEPEGAVSAPQRT